MVTFSICTARAWDKDRLGIDDKRPILDQVKETWDKPLVVGSRPGIFIPAPQGVLDSYIAMLNSYSAGDYSNAVDIAAKTYQKICPMIELFSGAQVDVRFALVASNHGRSGIPSRTVQEGCTSYGTGGWFGGEGASAPAFGT